MRINGLGQENTAVNNAFGSAEIYETVGPSAKQVATSLTKVAEQIIDLIKECKGQDYLSEEQGIKLSQIGVSLEEITKSNSFKEKRIPEATKGLGKGGWSRNKARVAADRQKSAQYVMNGMLSEINNESSPDAATLDGVSDSRKNAADAVLDAFRESRNYENPVTIDRSGPVDGTTGQYDSVDFINMDKERYIDAGNVNAASSGLDRTHEEGVPMQTNNYAFAHAANGTGNNYAEAKSVGSTNTPYGDGVEALYAEIVEESNDKDKDKKAETARPPTSQASAQNNDIGTKASKSNSVVSDEMTLEQRIEARNKAAEQKRINQLAKARSGSNTNSTFGTAGRGLGTGKPGPSPRNNNGNTRAKRVKSTGHQNEQTTM